MNDDLKWIKRHYGEQMCKICRECFPTILETEGLLSTILRDNFYNDRTLVIDIIAEEKVDDFKNYIFSKIDVEKKEKIIIKKPAELLKEAGYTLYKCETEEDIQYFKKYYKKGEEICTFNGGRLKRCHVFFAVKDNLENISRSETPSRQDEYGTSVISIQFNRGIVNNVSIKNRYNHRVNNPDATFGNNLENIIEGLTQSFEEEYSYKINNSNNGLGFELKNYTKGPDGRFYKYTQEIDAVYYCTNNIIIKDGEVRQYEKEKYVLMENYLLDLQNNSITDLSGKDKAFPASFGDIEKIEIENIKDENSENAKNIRIYSKGLTLFSSISLNNANEITSIDMPNLKILHDNFLTHNHKLKKVELPKVEEIKDSVFTSNNDIEEIDLKYVLKIGNYFMKWNGALKKINLTNVKFIGILFLAYNEEMKTLYLDNVEVIEGKFMYYNESLEVIICPKIKKLGEGCTFRNEEIKNQIESYLLQNEKYQNSDYESARI